MKHSRYSLKATLILLAASQLATALPTAQAGEGYYAENPLGAPLATCAALAAAGGALQLTFSKIINRASKLPLSKAENLQLAGIMGAVGCLGGLAYSQVEHHIESRESPFDLKDAIREAQAVSERRAAKRVEAAQAASPAAPAAAAVTARDR